MSHYPYSSKYLPAAPVVEIRLGRNVLNRLRLLLDGPAGMIEVLDA